MIISSNDFGSSVLERLNDLENRSNIKLSKYQKILLAEIGTVEMVLSLIVNSPIKVEVIKQQRNTHGEYLREVWLCDNEGKRLLHAASICYIDKIPSFTAVNEVTNGRIGIGSIIAKNNIDSTRVITNLGYDDSLKKLFRTYTINHADEIMFSISESFGIDQFRD